MNNDIFWKKVQQHNLKLLAAQANSNGGKAEATVESVLDNLQYLTEKGQSFGEEKKFLRLDVRRALGSLCDTGRLVFKAEPSSIRWTQNDESVTIGGYLYEARPDGTEIRVSGFSCGGAARSDVFKNEDLTNAERVSAMLSLASARAESNAYYNAGIGIEYKDRDVFDLEALEAQIPAPDPVMPTPVSQEEKKAKRASRASKKAKENTGLVTTKESSENETKEDTLSETKPEKEESSSSSVPETASDAGMSYEDAMGIIIDCGVYNGKTIGEVLSSPGTARNVVWVFKQDPEGRSPETKKALSLAIDGYNGGVLKKFL